MKIDWINRPKSATHYDPGSVDRVCWYRPNHQRGWDYWSESAAGSEWIHCGCVSNQFHFIEVPAEFAWSEGDTPPAGIDVEVLHSGHEDWTVQHINYIGGPKGIVVFRGEVDQEFACPVMSCQFRPLRSTEQIAAEERDIEIQGLADELAGYDDEVSARDRHREMATYLIDQGYGKKVKP